MGEDKQLGSRDRNDGAGSWCLSSGPNAVRGMSLMYIKPSDLMNLATIKEYRLSKKDKEAISKYLAGKTKGKKNESN